MSPRPRRVLVVAPLYPPAFLGGGPIRTLAALVATAPRDLDLLVVAGHRDLGARRPLPVPADRWTSAGAARVRYVDRRRPASVLRALASAGDVDLVYVNGLFDPVFSMLVRAWARHRGLPVLLAPRGELSPAALAIHAGRKRIALRVLARAGLDDGTTWHASSEREADDVRAVLGARTPVVVREDDHDLPRRAQRTPSRAGPLRIAFVSRLVPNKGLHVLLGALATVEGDWLLDVHGVAEDRGYAERCRRVATSPPLRGRVRLHGVLAAGTAPAVFAQHDCFAFPTATENFGHVIAESLSAGCPVLVADTTPWTARIAAGGGTVVPSLAVADWTTALQDWTSADVDERMRRSTRAADSYDAWRARAEPHLLDLVRGRFDLDRGTPGGGAQDAGDPRRSSPSGPAA